MEKFIIGDFVVYNSKSGESDTGKIIDRRLNEHGNIVYLVKFDEDYYSWLTEKYLEKL